MRAVASLAASFASGALFAAGLAVSGMVRPAKVVGFLDVAGAWDASLAFVMAGALAVHVVLRALVRRRGAPLFDAKFHVPTHKDIDAPLVLGAAIFGIGWGLGGYCPGPGLVSAASGALPAAVFVVGLTLGTRAEQSLGRSGVREVSPR
jgi:uncharacterized protein